MIAYAISRAEMSLLSRYMFSIYMSIFLLVINMTTILLNVFDVIPEYVFGGNIGFVLRALLFAIFLGILLIESDNKSDLMNKVMGRRIKVDVNE